MELINKKTHVILEVSGEASGGDWVKLDDYKKSLKAAEKAKSKESKAEVAEESE